MFPLSDLMENTQIDRIIKSVMGYSTHYKLVVDTSDYFFLGKVESVTRDILNYCNLTKIPNELEHVVARRVFGEMLRAKLETGGFKKADDNIEDAGEIKSISEGDTRIEYAQKSNALDEEVAIRALIDESCKFGKDYLNEFRKIRW